MTDFFDIANLITTVGVEATKIKQEPGLPEKSSNEILTELFSTFDADEGIASPAEDSQAEDAEDKSALAKKKKKSKKKHKHKDKKHKKKGKHDSSDSDSDGGLKKKKKSKKKSKRKSDGSNSEGPDAKKQKIETNLGIKLKIEAEDDDKVVGDSNKLPAEETKSDLDSLMALGETKDLGSPILPPMARKTREDDDDDTTGLGKPRLLVERGKSQNLGKILIKDLKNSAVYNETVKEIEIKEKEKAARMEDGEISDSSSYNRTPTLSPTPPRDRGSSMDSRSRSPLTYGKRNRTRSPSSGAVAKTDLRLVLKEKEKKKMSRGNKCDNRDSRKSSREHRNSKDSRHGEHGRESRDSRRRSKDRRDRSDDRRSGRSRDSKKYDKDGTNSHRSRSEDKYKDKYSRPRSRSKERKERIEIDKKKLLEIARRNAINMIKQGTLPLAQQDKAIVVIQTGAKTVDELTDFCKTLSKSEALGELSSISSDDDGNASEKGGFHHPFVLRERPTSIIMNIKDAKQLPNKTFQEKTAESSTVLRLQFPVSSGQHHRKSESEWKLVVPKKPEPKKAFVPATSKPAAQTFSIQPPVQQSLPAPAPVPMMVPMPSPIPMSTSMPAHAPMGVPPVMAPQISVFPQPPLNEPDIGSIVSQRLSAMRRLRENPNDSQALTEIYHAQNGMKNWAESKQMPGQFTGSTNVRLLSPAELHSGNQAWARKDQLVTAAPVSGGMGMALLQKMGWRPGEGLGKNKEGSLVPLQLEVKLDKRGLLSDQDIGQKPAKAPKASAPTVKTLEAKHPVSLLGEYCAKRKFEAPTYTLCFECGPDHQKNFVFKVKVNGIEYKPSIASPNKKQAKAEAAQICLQTLGILLT